MGVVWGQPYETVTAPAPLILAGISLTHRWILKDDDLPYYPRRWGLKIFTGDHFLLIFSLLVVTWITLILQDEGSRAAAQGQWPGLAEFGTQSICSSWLKSRWEIFMEHDPNNQQFSKALLRFPRCRGDGHPPPPEVKGWGLRQIREKADKNLTLGRGIVLE